MLQPQNTFFLGLLKSCLELPSSNAKINEKDPLVQWFQDRIYSEDLIDLDFPDEISEMKYDLILLSGTPGSGKTQFIKKLKQKLVQEKGFAIVKDQERVQEFKKDDKMLVVKHDATQVDSEADNAAKKLGQLLAEEWDDRNFDRPKKHKTFLIGINQGVLQRLFALEGFKTLSQAVKSRNDRRIMVVDLAMRSVVDPENRKYSFVSRLLERLCAKSLWEEPPVADSEFTYETCSECEIRDRSLCPILNNVQELRDKEICKRINELFELSHFRSGQIITYRDVLAILSKAIGGYHGFYPKSDRPCDVIREQALQCKEGNYLNLYRLSFFNSIFGDQDIWSEWLNRENKDFIKGYQKNIFSGYCGPYFQKEGQMVGLMAYLDPADCTAPDLRKLDNSVYNDPQTYFDQLKCKCKNELEKSVYKSLSKKLTGYDEASDLTELTNRDPICAREWMLFCILRIARRREIFYGDENVFKLTDYLFAESFIGAIHKMLKDKVDELNTVAGDAIRGVSGLTGSRNADRLEVDLCRGGKGVKAGIILDTLGKFDLPANTNLPDVIEYYPNILIFKLFQSETQKFFAELELDLDAWECLMRAAHGYLKDFLGVRDPKILNGFIEGIRAKIWLQQGVYLAIRDKENRVEISKAGKSLRLR